MSYMDFSYSSSSVRSTPKRSFMPEKRPRMLKDFLREDLIPHKSPYITIQELIGFDLRITPKPSNTKHVRQGNATMFAFYSIFKSLRKIPFTSMKNPPILPRSLSRKLSKHRLMNSQNGKKEGVEAEVEGKIGCERIPAEKSEIESAKIGVTIKDIIRWKSFRDLVEEEENELFQSKTKSQALECFCTSPHQCTTTTITTRSTSTPCSSNGSSWCDSDFTADFSPPRSADNFVEFSREDDFHPGKKFSPCVGREKELSSLECDDPTLGTATWTTTRNFLTMEPKREQFCEDKDQRSPVSVIDVQFREDGECWWSSKPSPANLVIVDKDEWLEETNEVEEKAMELLHHVKASMPDEYFFDNLDNLLLDLFENEIIRCDDKIYYDDEFDGRMVNMAKCWIRGETCEEWGIKGNKGAYVREMDREGRWMSKFEEEQSEFVEEIGAEVLDFLVKELLAEV